MTQEEMQAYHQALINGLPLSQHAQQSQLGQSGVQNNGNWPANQALHGGSSGFTNYNTGPLPIPGTPTSIPSQGARAAYGPGVNVTNPGTAYVSSPISGMWMGVDGILHEYSPKKPIEKAGIRVGEITGWRMWQYKKGYLQSYSADRIYAPGEPMSADPDTITDYSHAGIWAFKERSRALHKMLGEYDTSVCGSIKMWGKVIEHDLGYRSEFASIASIDDIHFLGEDRKVKQKVLQDLRETYGLAT